MREENPFLERLKAKVVPRDPEPLMEELIHRKLAKSSHTRESGGGERLPFEQEELLVRINRAPFVQMGERRRELGYGTNTKGWERLKEGMVKGGYLLDHEIVAGGSGSACKMLGLTQRGKAYLEAQGEKINAALRHGDFPHCYYLAQVRALYEARYECRVDEVLRVGGEAYRPDLLCLGEAERGAVEIVTSRNVGKDLKKLKVLGRVLDWVRVATSSEELRKRFQTEVEACNEKIQKKVEVARVQRVLQGAH